MKLYNVGGMRYLKIRYEYIIVLMMILLICLVVGIISIIRGFRKIKEKDLNDDIISTEKLQDESVTTAKIKDASVTSDKLQDDVVVNEIRKFEYLSYTSNGQSVYLTPDESNKTILLTAVQGVHMYFYLPTPEIGLRYRFILLNTLNSSGDASNIYIYATTNGVTTVKTIVYVNTVSTTTYNFISDSIIFNKTSKKGQEIYLDCISTNTTASTMTWMSNSPFSNSTGTAVTFGDYDDIS